MLYYNDDIPDNDPEDDWDALPRPVNRMRMVVMFFAFIMILALLGGSLLQAWSVIPTLLGYWRSDYRLILTEVAAGDCSRSRTGATTIDPDRLLCICGVMDAQQSDADVDIHVHTQEGVSLGTLPLRGQPTGPFCRSLRLEDRLEPGQYVLIGT